MPGKSHGPRSLGGYCPWGRKESDMTERLHFSLSHCSMSGSNCGFLTCKQISQETSKVVWYSHLFLRVFQFVVIHTVKGFSIVNEAKVDFLELPCFFYDRMDVCNLISVSSAFSESSLYNWKISDHILLKTSLKDFEHYLASTWNECNCTVVWTFFGTTFLWDWNENPSAPQEKPTQEASVLQWRVAPTCCN